MLLKYNLTFYLPEMYHAKFRVYFTYKNGIVLLMKLANTSHNSKYFYEIYYIHCIYRSKGNRNMTFVTVKKINILF